MLYLLLCKSPESYALPCRSQAIFTNSKFNLRGAHRIAPRQSDGAMLPVFYPPHQTLSKIQRIGFAGMKSLRAMLAHAF